MISKLGEALESDVQRLALMIKVRSSNDPIAWQMSARTVKPFIWSVCGNSSFRFQQRDNPTKGSFKGGKSRDLGSTIKGLEKCVLMADRKKKKFPRTRIAGLKRKTSRGRLRCERVELAELRCGVGASEDPLGRRASTRSWGLFRRGEGEDKKEKYRRETWIASAIAKVRSRPEQDALGVEARA